MDWVLFQTTPDQGNCRTTTECQPPPSKRVAYDDSGSSSSEDDNDDQCDDVTQVQYLSNAKLAGELSNVYIEESLLIYFT